MRQLLVVFFLALLAGSARADELRDCETKSSPDLIALCKGQVTGSIDYCNAIGNHDKKLYCYGILRRSASACRQVMSDALEQQCLTEIGQPAPPKRGTPSASAGRTHATTTQLAVDPTHGTAECEGASDPELKLVCKAIDTQNPDYCAEIGNHDKKLYCYGRVRRSASACRQVMDDALSARCLGEIAR